MTEASYSNSNLTESVQIRRLCFTLIITILAILFVTPFLTGVLGFSPRKTSVSVLRFTFLIMAALTWRRGGPGLAAESGLLIRGNPLKIWIRGFFMGAVPLAIYVVILILIGERQFDGIQNQQKFWGAVAKYFPLALIIGFLEDMLFFGFLATLLGRRYWPAVVIYAVAHFLAPSKQHDWSQSDWLVGVEALGAMGDSLAAATGRPVELLGLCFVGGTLAILCRRTGNIWLAMGVHGGWYYVRTISRKVSDDLEGNWEWLFGSDRFYDGFLGWLAIVSTALIYWLTTRTKQEETRAHPAR